MENEHLNEDELGKLRLENEIMKLKMQAQFGAVFGEGSAEMTPEMEHAFLKNVLAFEEQYQNRKMITVYDLLDRPAFIPAEQLTQAELEAELKRLLQLMTDKGVNFHANTKNANEVMYRFITEELFVHETDDMRVEGMTQNFIYEEFHPNHKLDLEEATLRFLKNWFEQQFEEDDYFFEQQMVLPNAAPPSFITREEVLHKLKQVFDSYVKFDDCKFFIADIGFQWDESTNSGMGHGEGRVKYTAVLENGEQQLVEDAFKIYFSNRYGAWSVMHFIFPGFNW